MGFTSTAATVNNNAGSATTIATPALAGINVGDFIFVAVVGENIPTISVSDGTSSLSPLGQINFGDSTGTMQGFYLLSSVASGTVTYTATYSGSTAHRAIIIWAWTPTGAVTFDQGTAAETTGSTSGNSGNVTTVGSDDLAIGYSLAGDGGTASSQQINGSAYDQTSATYEGLTFWWKTYGAPFTGAATFTNSGVTKLVTGIATFKIATAAASGIVTSSSIIRVPGARRQMIIPG